MIVFHQSLRNSSNFREDVYLVFVSRTSDDKFTFTVKKVRIVTNVKGSSSRHLCVLTKIYS